MEKLNEYISLSSVLSDNTKNEQDKQIKLIQNNYELLEEHNKLIQFYLKNINELKVIEHKPKTIKGWGINYGLTDDERQKFGDNSSQIKDITNPITKNLILVHSYLSLNGYVSRYFSACACSYIASSYGNWEKHHGTAINNAEIGMIKASYDINDIEKVIPCINSIILSIEKNGQLSDAEKLFYNVHLLSIVEKSLEVFELLLKDNNHVLTIDLKCDLGKEKAKNIDSTYINGKADKINGYIQLTQTIHNKLLRDNSCLISVSYLNEIMLESQFCLEAETNIPELNNKIDNIEKKQAYALNSSSSFYKNNIPTVDLALLSKAFLEYIHEDKYNKDSSDKSVKRAMGYLICLKQCSSENPLRAILLVYTLLNDKHWFYGENLNNKVNAVVSKDFLQKASQYLIKEFNTTDNLKNASNLLVEIIMDDERRMEADCGEEIITHLEMDFINICNGYPPTRENCLIQ